MPRDDESTQNCRANRGQRHDENGECSTITTNEEKKSYEMLLCVVVCGLPFDVGSVFVVVVANELKNFDRTIAGAGRHSLAIII